MQCSNSQVWGCVTVYTPLYTIPHKVLSSTACFGIVKRQRGVRLRYATYYLLTCHCSYSITSRPNNTNA